MCSNKKKIERELRLDIQTVRIQLFEKNDGG